MEYHYAFAGISICVNGPEDIIYKNHGVLTPFLSENPNPDAFKLSFSLVDSLSEPVGECAFRDVGLTIYRTNQGTVRYLGAEGHVHMRIQRDSKGSIVECLRREYPNRISPKTVLNAMEAEHLIVQNGGFLLHASYIQVNGKAILFTAPSGTGKSTQADLWCKYQNARLINGDRVAVRFEKDQVLACGIPFSGSSGVSHNITLPVAAVVYLSQAPTNSAVALNSLSAFRMLWEGCCVNLWDREDVTLATDSVLKTIQAVPVIHFSCTADQSAADYLATYLSQRRILNAHTK